MKNYLLFLLVLATFNPLPFSAAEYQWSVKLKGFISSETGESPNAFLWIPSDCRQVQAVVVGQHNMCEETIFDHPEFRKAMSGLGFAIVWISPGIDQQWDVKNGCQEVFDHMMRDFAVASGYSELQYAPVVPIGHSAMATFPWNFAAWNADRTLAVISYKGDAPRTNLCGYGRENLEWGRTRNIDGIPGLMVEGEYEWWEARVNPALAFRMMYPESCISFVADVGHGHFDVSAQVVNYISLFLKKAAQYRLPADQPLNKPVQLVKINPENGWLAQRWHPVQPKRAKTAPFARYKGDIHDAFWYFDKEIAEATEQYYAKARSKKEQYLSFIYSGKLLPYASGTHLKYDVSNIISEPDGITYHLSAAFTDSLHQDFTAQHARTPVKIDRICGPAKKVDDSTFIIQFYRMGFNNSKRSNDIYLLAHNDGDKEYKSVVQQFSLRIAYPLAEGKRQNISFPCLRDVKKGKESITLNATTDSGLPVYYYVKEGPAEVDGNQLIFRKIPPRSKFPVKVTVVAWQIGLKGRIQSAKEVEQIFYIIE